MGLTYRFIEQPGERSEVFDWFRSQPQAPEERAVTDRSVVLYFHALGALAMQSNGEIDSRSSPVVTLFKPRTRRGLLWTVGEVHFLPTPLRLKFPELHEISRRFAKWLSAMECVYSNKRAENEFGYYLEGSIKEYDSPVYALPSGGAALRDGRYFVGEGDTEARLDGLCSQLRLRGVECTGV